MFTATKCSLACALALCSSPHDLSNPNLRPQETGAPNLRLAQIELQAHISTHHRARVWRAWLPLEVFPFHSILTKQFEFLIEGKRSSPRLFASRRVAYRLATEKGRLSHAPKWPHSIALPQDPASSPIWQACLSGGGRKKDLAEKPSV